MDIDDSGIFAAQKAGQPAHTPPHFRYATEYASLLLHFSLAIFEFDKGRRMLLRQISFITAATGDGSFLFRWVDAMPGLAAHRYGLADNGADGRIFIITDDITSPAYGLISFYADARCPRCAALFYSLAGGAPRCACSPSDGWQQASIFAMP